MKKVLIFLAMICLSMVNLSYAQLIPDAGQQRVVCVDLNGMDTIALGGSPSATGGTPPYTFLWETEYTSSIGGHTFHFTASDFLNDTTLANPDVMHAIGDTIVFRLTVTDSLGNTGNDTTIIHFAYFTTHLGYTDYSINQGDSVFLSGWENVFGGFPPYTYLWQPNHGLSDSTSLSFWAKPDYSVAYYMTLFDSAGCVVIGAPVYYVHVQPLGFDDYENPDSILKVFPNPVNDFLNITVNPAIRGAFTLRLFLSNGKLINQQTFPNNEFQIDLMNYPSGVYIYEIGNDEGFKDQGKIVVQ